MDRVEHSPYRATNTVTEMNFGLRSAGNGRLARHARPGQGSTYLRTAIIRYTPRAVGLKPSAMECEARLRGLWWIIYSKTISPRLWNAKPACAGYGGLFTQRPSDASLLVSPVLKGGERLPYPRATPSSSLTCTVYKLHQNTTMGISARRTYTSITTGKTIGRRRVCP